MIRFDICVRNCMDHKIGKGFVKDTCTVAEFSRICEAVDEYNKKKKDGREI